MKITNAPYLLFGSLEMSEALFDGTIRGEDRIRYVESMMGCAPGCGPRDFIDRLLSKAEYRAHRWLLEEIAECMRGEAAHRYLER